jgi:hypothetical protein
MDILKNINLGLAFFLELFMLVAFVWGGFSLHVSTPVKVLVGAVTPIAVVALWSLFFAPTSRHRMTTPWLQLAIITLYGIAAFVLSRGGHTKQALIFFVIDFINLGLAIIWKQ